MPSYRVAELEKLYRSKKITIDFAEAKKSEGELLVASGRKFPSEYPATMFSFWTNSIAVEFA